MFKYLDTENKCFYIQKEPLSCSLYSSLNLHTFVIMFVYTIQKNNSIASEISRKYEMYNKKASVHISHTICADLYPFPIHIYTFTYTHTHIHLYIYTYTYQSNNVH